MTEEKGKQRGKRLCDLNGLKKW